MAQWSALFALEGTPAPVFAKLRRSVEATLAEPEIVKKFTNAAMDISTMSADAFHQRMIQDRERWAKLIKEPQNYIGMKLKAQNG